MSMALSLPLTLQLHAGCRLLQRWPWSGGALAPALRHLDACKCPQLPADPAAFASLTSLTSVGLTQHMLPLLKLPNISGLSRLDLRGNEPLFSDLDGREEALDPVLALTGLRELSLADCGTLPSCNKLQELTQLTLLDVTFSVLPETMDGRVGWQPGGRHLQLPTCIKVRTDNSL